MNHDLQTAIMIAARGIQQKVKLAGKVVNKPGRDNGGVEYHAIISDIWACYCRLGVDLETVLLAEDKHKRNLLQHAALCGCKDNFKLVVSFYKAVFGDLKAMMQRRPLVDITQVHAELKPLLLKELYEGESVAGKNRSSRSNKGSNERQGQLSGRALTTTTQADEMQEVDQNEKMKKHKRPTKKKPRPTMQKVARTQDAVAGVSGAKSNNNNVPLEVPRKKKQKVRHSKEEELEKPSGKDDLQELKLNKMQISRNTSRNKAPFFGFVAPSPIRCASDCKDLALDAASSNAGGFSSPPPPSIKSGAGMWKTEEPETSPDQSSNNDTSTVEIPPSFRSLAVLKPILLGLLGNLEGAMSGVIETDDPLQLESVEAIRVLVENDGPHLPLGFMLRSLRGSMVARSNSNTVFEKHLVNAMLAAFGFS